MTHCAHEFGDRIANICIRCGWDAWSNAPDPNGPSTIDELALATLRRVQQDVNWMLNNGKLLNPEVFAYLHEAIDELTADG